LRSAASHRIYSGLARATSDGHPVYVRRIAIVGPGGSGKSRLARELSEATEIRIVYLDNLFWRPGWVETPPVEWESIQRRALAGDSWIVEGLHGDTAHLWLDVADTIVFLDASLLLFFRRVTRRRLGSLGGPDVPAGCEPAPFYRALVKFLRYLWRYVRTTRAEILADLARRRGGPRIVVLRGSVDVQEFVRGLPERPERFVPS
jgi:adenylate kinase family enzyme